MLNIIVIRPLPYAGKLLQNVRKIDIYYLLKIHHRHLLLFFPNPDYWSLFYTTECGLQAELYVDILKMQITSWWKVPRFFFDTFQRALFFSLWSMPSLWPSTEDGWVQCTLTSMWFCWPVIANMFKNDGVFDVHFMLNVNLRYI